MAELVFLSGAALTQRNLDEVAEQFVVYEEFVVEAVAFVLQLRHLDVQLTIILQINISCFSPRQIIRLPNLMPSI